jgi:ElaB/YqjD/DUF883 family membrane-anchored ribosome-binding protein
MLSDISYPSTLCSGEKIRYVESLSKLTLRNNHMAHDSNAENLRAELKSLADTLEEVLNSSTDKPKAELEKLRSKAEGALKDTRARLSDAGDKIASQTKQIAGQADDYVRDNPWTGIGIGAAVGVVLGVLLARR